MRDILLYKITILGVEAVKSKLDQKVSRDALTELVNDLNPQVFTDKQERFTIKRIFNERSAEVYQ